MDFARFMDCCGYNILFVAVLLIVLGIVFFPLLINIYAIYIIGGMGMALQAALIYGGVIILVLLISTKALHLLVKTRGKVGYLNRAKIFERREDIEYETFEEKYSRKDY